MIKQLGKHDTLMSPFLTVKGWSLANTDPQELVLTETTGSEEPVALEYMDYTLGDDTGSLNRDCNIALEQQSTDQAIPEEGVSGSGKFFPDSEPINAKTGHFKRLIHDQIYRAFYNRYNNPLQIFGVDTLDFPLAKNNRYLADDFLMFSIPRRIFGERIQENTITLHDSNFDDNILINDDGHGNLIAKKNLFSKIQEARQFKNVIHSGYVFTCSSGSIPSGSITLIVTSGSAILHWNDPFNNEDGFIIEKSLDGITYNSYRTASMNVTYSVDENVTVGNTYWYKLYAFNSYGTSSHSNTASITFSGSTPGSLQVFIDYTEQFSGVPYNFNDSYEITSSGIIGPMLVQVSGQTDTILSDIIISGDNFSHPIIYYDYSFTPITLPFTFTDELFFVQFFISSSSSTSGTKTGSLTAIPSVGDSFILPLTITYP